MEYRVLARKWRPQSFADLVGQEHVTKTLSNAIRQNRIAHAFIFGGPRGVGKTSAARILAKAVNCEKGPTPTPCQTCTNCLEITAGTSIDVREIDGASNRGIDEVRELRENVKFAPASSRYKVYIIDEVHMLTREAFNALLKTLEEPPRHVIFIFATTEIQKIPATIISRCQCHEFRMIPLRQIAENLRKIAEAESIRISGAGINWIAEAGNGSLRDSQSVFDQIISFAGSDIRDADVEEALSLADRRFLFTISEALFEKDTGKCLKVIKEGYFAGLDMKYFYKMLLNHFRNLLFVKIAGGDSSLFDLPEGDLARLKTQSRDVGRETLQKYLDMLLGEEENMRRTQDPRLLLETIVVRMAGLEELLPLDEILARMEGLERRLKTGLPEATIKNGLRQAATVLPSPVAANEDEGPPEAREACSQYQADTNQEQLWTDYKAFIKKHSPPLCSKIEQGQFLGFKDRSVTLGFRRDYIFIDDVKSESYCKRLAEISRDFFRENVEVKIQVLEPDNDDPSGKARSQAKNNHDLKQEVLNHPLLQKVLDIFEGAEVREIIPRKMN